jgi:hypothetical protein
LVRQIVDRAANKLRITGKLRIFATIAALTSALGRAQKSFWNNRFLVY